MELAHVPLLMVQRNVVLVPAINPVTVLVGEFAVVIFPLPLTMLHDPVPTVGAFALNVAVVILHNTWSGPAAEVVGNS